MRDNSKSEIRKNYFKDEYVIIVPRRAKRPQIIDRSVGVEKNKTCFFCPHSFTDEISTYQDNNKNGDWEIISVINKFSSLTNDSESAYGQSEVIIETRKHGLNMSEFSIDHIVRIFDAYIDRLNNLKNMHGIKYVTLFKNKGKQAGASIAHAHSQVIALPIIPPKLQQEAESYTNYLIQHHNCPYCDIISNESNSQRVIWQDDNTFLLAPYASEFAYEAWLIPKRHTNTFSELSHTEKESYAKALKIVLAKLDHYDMPYNYYIENTINNDYHTHIKITPRINVWAGLELSTGVIANPISPEFAADFYRSKTETKGPTSF